MLSDEANGQRVIRHEGPRVVADCSSRRGDHRPTAPHNCNRTVKAESRAATDGGAIPHCHQAAGESARFAWLACAGADAARLESCAPIRDRRSGGARQRTRLARKRTPNKSCSLSAWPAMRARSQVRFPRSRLSARDQLARRAAADCSLKASIAAIGASHSFLPEVSPQQLSAARKARHHRADRNA